MSKILLKDIISYKKGNAFKSTDYQKDGVAIVRVSDFENDTVNLNNLYYVSKEVADKNKNVILNKYDVVVTTVGASAGNFIRVPEMAEGYLLNQNAVRLRINSDEKFEKIYLFYALKYKKFTQYLLAGAQGSAQPSIVLDQILNAEIPYPKKDRRKYISEVLFTLDEKIELNTQINQTLEQIAQTIFKSWFIDFDPVHAKAEALANGQTAEQATQAAMAVISGKNPEELHRLQTANPEQYQQLWEIAEAFPSGVDEEGVPWGWEITTIDENYNIVMGQSPKGETYNEESNGTLFYQGRAEFGWRYPEPRLYTTDPKRIAKKSNILMSVRAPVGDLNVALEDCCIGRGLAALSHKSNSLSFGLYQIKNLQNEFDVFNGEGTVFGSINQKDLKSIRVINPSSKIIKLFDDVCSTNDLLIENLSREIISLRMIRDELLPKLLSGEV